MSHPSAFLFLSQASIDTLPYDAHPMGILVGSICALSAYHADANPAIQVCSVLNLIATTVFQKHVLPTFMSFLALPEGCGPEARVSAQST